MIYKPQPDQAAVYVIYLAYARCEILNGKAVQCEISCYAGCEIFARKRANVMITLELMMPKLRLKRSSEIGGGGMMSFFSERGKISRVNLSEGSFIWENAGHIIRTG